jgi:formamidopyrimidine-DNA glycosylase
MPELPDVAIFKRYLDATGLHQRVGKVKVLSTKVMNVSRQKLASNVTHHPFVNSRRHGKFLFLETDHHKWVMLHFGMTGFLKYYRDEDEAPDHPRVIFHFINGYSLAYDNQRMFGEVDLTDDVDAYIKSRGMGPDALDVEWDQFKERIDAKSGAVKSTLMDQSFLAGIGNVYSDEIIFQSDLHPTASINQLSDKQLKNIYRTMRRVLEKMIDYNADPAKVPHSYLLRHRSQFEDCPRCGGTIKKITVANRNGYFCSGHQQK